MAAVALFLGACSNENNEIEMQPEQQAQSIHFKATIGAADGTTTRTVYDEAQSGRIYVEWEEGDQVALVYGGKKDVATVTAIDQYGIATIEADITGTPEDGDPVELIYPAAAVKADGTLDATYMAKIRQQDGTLEDIQDNLDIREAEGQFSVSGGKASLKGNVKLASQIAVWKLTLQDNQTTPVALNATHVSIYVGGSEVAGAALATPKSVWYICVLPATMGTGDLAIKATAADSNPYKYTKTGGVTLAANKYYQSTVTMEIDLSWLNLYYDNGNWHKDFAYTVGETWEEALAHNPGRGYSLYNNEVIWDSEIEGYICKDGNVVMSWEVIDPYGSYTIQ